MKLQLLRFFLTFVLTGQLMAAPQSVVPGAAAGADEDIFADFEVDLSERELKSTFTLPRFTFAYHAGSSLDDDVTNNSRKLDARMQWEQLFSNGYFVRLDGKAIVRLPNDRHLEDNENHEFDSRLRELYLQSGTDFFGLTLGQQLLVWGEMDTLQIADVMSPRDFSEFAFTSPEDARLGQPLINGQWHWGNNSLELVYNLFPQVNRYPGGNVDALLIQLLGTDQVEINQNRPEALDDYELGLRWHSVSDQTEFNVMFARLLVNDPRFSITGTNALGQPVYSTDYPDYLMLGFSLNYVDDNFLWKLEAAHKYEGLTNFVDRGQSNSNELGIGFDYNANNAYTLSLENSYQYIQGDVRSTGLKKETSQSAIRWNKLFLHDNLDMTLFFSYQWQYSDTVTSLSAAYSISDQWKAELNVTTFHSGDNNSPAQVTRDWDQAVVKVSYSI